MKWIILDTCAKTQDRILAEAYVILGSKKKKNENKISGIWNCDSVSLFNMIFVINLCIVFSWLVSVNTHEIFLIHVEENLSQMGLYNTQW